MITIPLPPSVNAIHTKNGRVFKSAERKQWDSDAGYLLLSQDRRKFGCPVYVGLTFFFKRASDIDNRIKPVLDLLQTQGIIVNDNLIEHLNVKKYIDKSVPRCEIEIEPIES